MNFELNLKGSIGKILLVSIFVLIIATIGCSAEGGASAGFNANDSGYDEWSGVPVFTTDPAGDVPNPDEDILEVKVANSPADGGTKEVYFLMKVTGNPALQGQYKASIVSIDCDGNGVDQEPHDRLVVYVPSEDQYYIMRGDQSEGFTGNAKDGQVVGEFIEWKVSLSDLPPDEKDSGQCTGNVKLLFATADVTQYFTSTPGETQSKAIIIDDAGSLKDWNIP